MMTKKQLFNAKSAGLPLEDGTQFVCTAVGTYDDTDRDGKPVTATALVASDGSVYTAIGSGIADSVALLDEIREEEGAVESKCVVSQTKKGRDFKQLMIVE